MSLSPLINLVINKEWIEYIWKYMINMGAIETTSRLIIEKLNNTNNIAIYSEDLDNRIKYLQARYPNDNKMKHQKAMKMFKVLKKHIWFRNIIAHSWIMYVKNDDKQFIGGLLNFQPKNKANMIAEFISIEEMKWRVDESAKLGSLLLEFQNDFTLEKVTYN